MLETDAIEFADAQAVWSQLRAVERLTVTVIVDNETDGLSSPCACCDPSLDPSTSTPYQSEFTWAVHQVTGGRWPSLDFRHSLQAGHGLSLLVSASTADGAVSRLLFDGGPREDLWTRNAERLGLDMGEVEAAVLSHWHVDHSVGLLAVARAASEARSGTWSALREDEKTEPSSTILPGHLPQAEDSDKTCPEGELAPRPPSQLPQQLQQQQQQQEDGDSEAGLQPGPPPPVQEPFVFDLHPSRPLLRGLLLGASHKPVPFDERDPTLEQLSLPGCRVELHAGPHTLLRNCFFVSGSIPRVSSFETGQPGHGTLGPDGNWQLDPHIMEERYLAVRVRGRGVVVLSGCSHAGIVNVVRHVKGLSGEPVFGVMGGLHLAGGKMEGRIPETVAALRELNPARVFGGHCTGWRAKIALAAALSDRFQPMSVGSTYTFLAARPGEQQERAGDEEKATKAVPGGQQPEEPGVGS
ncbi:hypothetical protein VOLCADRAFT_89597 [Volvox carteri f. nagariensis]|uniref:Metallo-beta-lactamase domain-containing protein n=1 Tax=Volvox carteri f. nagariensis TaxID=3068 RepID=D8TS94_VOLCA|nr:uncharacterized protein VOLCADRAFT_89597 [Volvox carteri f. nagariensis]EFJ49653.1 hypothetical protein VOLCADRAFT_89597 [Volvox carteri f. nagariensis]|eukprot:XP_002949160.1 hypothetical protein VOLCADRAFT_89597 [Volvox carteri f. nagariensis]